MVTPLLGLDTAGGLGAFLLAVLHDGWDVEVGSNQLVDRLVVRKKVWTINLERGFVGLLVEVDRSHPVLHLFEVGSDIDHVVDRPHVAEQAQIAALGEFNEFLGHANFVQILASEVLSDECVAGDSGNVLLDQGVLADQIADTEGGENVFQFEPANTRGVGVFHVVMIRVAVELVDDSDAKGSRIAEVAEVNALDREMLRAGKIAADLEQRVNGGQLRLKLHHDLRRVGHRQPKCFASRRVFVGHGSGEAQQVVVDQRHVGVAPAVMQVLHQGGSHWVFLFAAQDHVCGLIAPDTAKVKARRG